MRIYLVCQIDGIEAADEATSLVIQVALGREDRRPGAVRKGLGPVPCLNPSMLYQPGDARRRILRGIIRTVAGITTCQIPIGCLWPFPCGLRVFVA